MNIYYLFGYRIPNIKDDLFIFETNKSFKYPTILIVTIFTLEVLKKVFEEYHFTIFYLFAYIVMNTCEISSPLLGLLSDSILYSKEKETLYENMNEMKEYFYPMGSEKFAVLIKKFKFAVIIQNCWCVCANIYNGILWNSKLYHTLHFTKQMMIELMLVQIGFEISLSIYYLRSFSDVWRSHKNYIVNYKLLSGITDFEETIIFTKIENRKSKVRTNLLKLYKVNDLYEKMIENSKIISKRLCMMVSVSFIILYIIN